MITTLIPSAALLPKVTCDKCNKPVEKLSFWRDPRRREWECVAECHGEKETCFIPESIFYSRDTSIEGAVAFKQQEKLPCPPNGSPSINVPSKKVASISSLVGPTTKSTEIDGTL